MLNDAKTPPIEEKVTDSVTFSGPAALIDAFEAHAKKLNGPRGVSRAGCEAMTEWLAKRGVSMDDPATLKNNRRMAILAALDDLGLDVDSELAAIRDRAGGRPPLAVAS